MSIDIHVQKKELWLLAAIVVFLVGIAYVIAYGGNQPAIHGHSIGELEGVCRSDGTGCPGGLGETSYVDCELVSAGDAAVCPADKFLVEMDRANCVGTCDARCCKVVSIPAKTDCDVVKQTSNNAANCSNGKFLDAMDRVSCTNIPGASGGDCYARCCTISGKTSYAECEFVNAGNRAVCSEGKFLVAMDRAGCTNILGTPWTGDCFGLCCKPA